MSRLSPNAFMLSAADGRQGQRMAVWHAPDGPAQRAVIHVHPFAEESNRSRRMAALQARALVAQGHAVLLLDLKGCGDSAGDFGDATWDDWQQDVLAAARWVRQRCQAPLVFWGLRAGCLVTAAAAAQWPERCGHVLWQPVASGAVVLRQFLRQAAAAAMLDGGGKGVVDTLQRELAAGNPIDVGGYRLHPALAAGLAAAELAPPPHLGDAVWLEVTPRRQDNVPTPPAPAANDALLQRWRDAASTFRHQIVNGPAFWQTAEIETAPALLEATTSALGGWPTQARPAAPA